jgi:hypothetical protein
MRNKNHHIVGTVPKSKKEIGERGNFGTLNIQIHDRSHSWLGAGTSLKNGGVGLISWDKLL